MRRVAGFVRQTEVPRPRTCARMPFMERDNPRHFPSFWRLQAIGWICFYLLGLVGSITDILNRPGALRGHTVTVAFMFLGSFALHPVCRSLFRRSPIWLAFEVRVAAACAVVGTVAAFATEATLLGFHKMLWPDLLGNSVQFSFVFFLWCSLYFSMKQWQQSAQEKERLLRAETEAREARLSALRYELNPHFLFNSLNAVSTLVLDGNAPAATRMLAQIGELLRTSLDNEVVSEVALSQEMAFTERYLDIEQTRLGDRLKVDLDIAPETLDALVPSMLLQPLVENAVRHGVGPLVQGGRIAIESGICDGQLRIVIRNSGRPGAERQKDNGHGIGLRNTTERLETLYAANHKFLLEWPETGGCEVTLELPYRKVAHPQEALPCAS